MKVIVKILQGEECAIEISPTETVLDLKNKAKHLLGIDVSQQKLIFWGKALADKNAVSFYPGIKDGSKLYLVVKKDALGSTQGSSDSKSPVTKSGVAKLKEEMSRILRHYYASAETDSIITEFVKDLRKKVDSLSYDDLERLATALLQDQESNA